MSLSSSERPGAGTWLCVLVAMAFFIVFLFYPLAYVFKKSMMVDGSFSFGFFKLLVQNRIMVQSLLNSFSIAIWVTVLSSALGFFFAALIVKTDIPFKGLWGNLLLAPLVMPPFVGAIGIKYIFGRFGMVNTALMQMGFMNPRAPMDWLGQPFWGVVIIEVLHLFPIMYLNIVGSYSMMDPALEEAGRSLGARGVALFRTVTMPLLAPGFFAGASIVFIWAFTDLGTPLLFEYRTVAPVQIFNNVQAAQENLIGYALVVVVLAVTALFFIASKYLFSHRRFEMPAFGRTSGTVKKMSWPVKTAVLFFMTLFVFISIIPHISVLLVSLSDEWFMTLLPESWTLSHFAQLGSHPVAVSSVRNSVMLSGVAMVLVLITGILIAYTLARKKFRGKELLDVFSMLPLAVPGVVLAFGYVQSFFGTALDPTKNPVPLLIAAYAVRRLPLVVRAMYSGFQQAGVVLEEASASLGAGQGATMRLVTFPLIRANMLGAAILAFAFSMLEVSDSLILAMQEKYYPMTKAIYVFMGRLGDGANVASAMGVAGIIILGVALVAAQKLLGRRLGDMFRT